MYVFNNKYFQTIILYSLSERLYIMERLRDMKFDYEMSNLHKIKHGRLSEACCHL